MHTISALPRNTYQKIFGGGLHKIPKALSFRGAPVK